MQCDRRYHDIATAFAFRIRHRKNGLLNRFNYSRFFIEGGTTTTTKALLGGPKNTFCVYRFSECPGAFCVDRIPEGSN